jgi:AcrR family transcriptional regulator
MLPAMPNAPATRVKLLAASRRAFAELGYNQARVADIVTRAGVGHGTFYAYFPNKRAALTALIKENAAALLELASQPWRPGDVRATLTEVIGGLSELYERDADLIALSAEAAAQDAELRAITDDVRRQFVDRVARNIERAQAQGQARQVDVRVAATALSAMTERTLMLRVTRAEPLDQKATVETLVDLWYHALYRADSADGQLIDRGPAGVT